MRRIQATAVVVLGLALAVVPAAGNAADLQMATGDDCGAGAGSTTDTVIYDGQEVTITTDNFGTCLVSNSQSVTAQSALAVTGAAPAVPVPGRPAFTG
jgi:hypothetical protein